MLIASTSRREAGNDVFMQPEDEPDLDRMAQRMQDLFNSRFYDQIDFSLEWRLAITKV